MLKKVLVAIDNLPISQHVFDEAVYLAKATDAKLMLLHVLSPPRRAIYLTLCFCNQLFFIQNYK